MPAFDGGDDCVGIGGPGEGLWLLVGSAQEADDGGLEIDDRAEDAALEAVAGQLGEEAFDGVKPGARCRREVEDEALVPVEPGAHLRSDACALRSCRG